MARWGATFLPEEPLHVIQRGNVMRASRARSPMRRADGSRLYPEDGPKPKTNAQQPSLLLHFLTG
jgi:hypothetical protein